MHSFIHQAVTKISVRQQRNKQARITPILMKLSIMRKLEKQINYYTTNATQRQISFPGPEAHKIWEMFLKEKNTKLKMQM